MRVLRSEAEAADSRATDMTMKTASPRSCAPWRT